MTSRFAFVVLLLVLVQLSTARLGFDLSVPADEDTWKCLQEEGKGSFGIVRVYRNIGQVDKNRYVPV